MLTPKSGPGVNFCCVAVLEEARSFSVGGGYVLDGRMMTTLGVRRSVVVVGLIAFLLVVLAALLATGCGNSGDLLPRNRLRRRHPAVHVGHSGFRGHGCTHDRPRDPGSGREVRCARAAYSHCPGRRSSCL